jgi:hypothetical protein
LLCIPWPINGTSPQFSQSTFLSGLYKTWVTTPSSPSKWSVTHPHTCTHAHPQACAHVRGWQSTYWFPLSLTILLTFSVHYLHCLLTQFPVHLLERRVSALRIRHRVPEFKMDLSCLQAFSLFGHLWWCYFGQFCRQNAQKTS